MYQDLGRVANPRPVAKIKTGLVSQPITDADDETGRDRSCIHRRRSSGAWGAKPPQIFPHMCECVLKASY